MLRHHRLFPGGFEWFYVSSAWFLREWFAGGGLVLIFGVMVHGFMLLFTTLFRGRAVGAAVFLRIVLVVCWL